MKAIITKYHGPTSTRSARISAKAEGVPRHSASYNHKLNADENHQHAADTLADKYGWRRALDPKTGYYSGPPRWTLVGGGLPDGTGYAFVFVPVRAEGA